MLKKIHIILPSWLFSLFTLPFAFFPFNSFSQNSFHVSANVHYGYIAAHHKSMAYLIKKHIPSLELAVSKSTKGDKLWQQSYRLPEIGMGAYLTDFGNPEQLGKAAALFTFINMPFTKKENISIGGKLGTGLGYLSERFDRVENHKNTVISSHINVFINLRLYAHFKVSDNFRIESGFGLSHFSNGAFKMPNLGINIPAVNLGFCYSVNPQKKEFKQMNDSLDKAIHYVIIAAGGVTEIEPPGGKKFPCTTLSFNLQKRLTQKSKVAYGAEAFYTSSIVEKINNDSLHYSNAAANTQFGLKLGYELVIDRLSLPIDWGVYLYSKAKSNGIFYHRIGLRYELQKRVILNLSLKTHWAKADYVEFGIGYVLK